MFRIFGVRGQVALVVGLFLGSLGVLLFNVLGTLDLPRQELAARANLQEAGLHLSTAAADLDVQAHGGRIELEETGPSGTTFRIELPCRREPRRPAL